MDISIFQLAELFHIDPAAVSRWDFKTRWQASRYADARAKDMEKQSEEARSSRQ